MDRGAAKAAETIAAECLAVRVRMLNRIVSGIYDDALRPLGIKVSQLNILVAVTKLGPVSPTRISLALEIEKSTLSRNVRRMRDRGWIGGSSSELRVTKRGRRLLEEALPLWRKAQKSVRRRLGSEIGEALHGKLTVG